jgi:hypothetical protein
MPPTRQNLFDGGGLELNGDKELGGAVEHRISTNEQTEIWIYSQQNSGVEPVWVLPKLVEAPVFGSVFELKTMLVQRPVPRDLRVGEERVRDDACPFPGRGLIGDPKRSRLG